MVLSLFRKQEVNPATALYESVVRAARQPGWYRDAGVPDTLDGRYCVLATLLAIADIRLGAGGESAAALSPRLTELLVSDLDVQLRESGLGDPTLGKTVRNLITGLSGRIAKWRSALDGGDWNSAIRSSLYRGEDPEISHQGAAKILLAEWKEQLFRMSDEELAEGLAA
ncbi:ubiquinol-cytochrome C chaperone [Sphingomonas sp. HDW15A]|uniref:ubiquinol-cytochrome C chaperone family protein n=1 Tax=Sphingomonas sp. HDW15A TaxID=2714942 RepID=UPI00140BCFBE|nr:ubiquinol-cytochrome C chaperone family protein [Sphingomonas sp. HDW15A]QIK97012.1 ubiquinol-cytochrome C chaperone [Sphingomonas sp. HDW15A]